MTATEYAAYAEASAHEYAAENVAAGRWPAAGAEARAEAEYARLLPDGLQTVGHVLTVLHDIEAVEDVGVLWYARREGEGDLPAEWFIYDFAVHPPFQGRGYGKAALAHLQALAQAEGVGRIGLHVFGSNERARRLYRAAGYTEASVLMRLDVPPLN